MSQTGKLGYQCKEFYFIMLFVHVIIQIFRCLQPFMVCVSPTATTNVIKHISECHDVEVHFWKDEMKQKFPVSSVCHYTYVASHVLFVQ